MEGEIVIRKKIIAIVILSFILLDIYCFYSSKYILGTSFYQIESKKIETPIRVVQLSDLHDSKFGENNHQIISRVAELSPEMIILTGDMIDQKNWNENTFAILLSQFVKIAPVYVSFGNQEDDIESAYDVNLEKICSDVGVVLLKNAYTDINLNGQSFRIGGIYGYCQNEAYAAETGHEDESVFLREF